METVKILITSENLKKIQNVGSITRIVNTLIEKNSIEDINRMYINKFSSGEINDTSYKVKTNYHHPPENIKIE